MEGVTTSEALSPGEGGGGGGICWDKLAGFVDWPLSLMLLDVDIFPGWVGGTLLKYNR